MMFLTCRPLSDDIYPKQKTTGNPPKTLTNALAQNVCHVCPGTIPIGQSKVPSRGHLKTRPQIERVRFARTSAAAFAEFMLPNNSILTQVIFNLKGGLTAWITPSNQVGEKNVTFTSELSLHVMPKKKKKKAKAQLRRTKCCSFLCNCNVLTAHSQ